MKNNYIVQGWLILVLAVLFGAALAGVQLGLSGRIEANKTADTMTQIPSLVPGSVSGDAEQLGDLLVYRTKDKQGKQTGWVVYTAGQGFADTIELLIGLNLDGSAFTGLYILAQNETPGLGNRITFPDNTVYSTEQDADAAARNAFFAKEGQDKAFRLQFSGRSTQAPLTVTKANDGAPDNDKIDALTGATISSQSVVDIINKAVVQFKQAVKKS